MIKRKSLVLVFLLALLAAGNASAASKKRSAAVDLGYVSGKRTETALTVNPAIKSGVLENGMSYYVLSNSDPKNRIFLRLAVKAGSCMEDDDQQGIAHLVEHMAFNGTEHFAERDMINFVESTGMQWGPELNAYTSYEETVYMLEIPADDKAVLEKAMLILRDWACAITFDPAEIEKEKGVVTEEWRLRQGAGQRFWDQALPVLLKDSRFVDRSPIGKTDVIAAVTPERVVDFYKKWYRPELMAVAIVGDLPAAELEKAVKSMMSDIPASEEKISTSRFPVPLPDGKQVRVVRDAEFSETNFFIESRIEDSAPLTTKEQMYENTLLALAGAVANQRLSEYAKRSDSPFLSAGVNTAFFTYTASYNALYARPKEGMVPQSLEALLTEMTRFLVHGATESELKRIKLGVKAELSQFKRNIKKIDSSNYISDIIRYFLNGDTPYSPSDYAAFMEEFLEQVTLDDIRHAAEKAFGGLGDFFFVRATKDAVIPSESELMEKWANFSAAELAAYEEESIPDILMERPAATAKVVSKKKLKNFGATEYVLDNGARIILKKTDFEKDMIRMSVSSAGGLTFVAEEDVPSASVADNYVWYSGINGLTVSQVQKVIADKNFGASWGMHRWGEYYNGWGSSSDFEVSLQILNQFFTNPQFTDEGWNYMYQQIESGARNFGASVNDVLNAQIKKFFYDDKPYYINHDMDFLSKLDKDKTQKAFRERFSNIADFNFVIVGDFNEKKLLDLCRAYIGSIPGDKDKTEECKFVYYSLPEGIKSSYVRKGTEPQAFVELMFRGNCKPAADVSEGFEDSTLISQMASLIETRLLEVVREDQSGTYGVGVSASFDGYPERQYTVMIQFGCAPERVMELRDSVISVLNEIKANGIEKSYTDNIAEIYRRNTETNLRDNGWWMNRIKGVYYDTTEPETVVSDMQKKIPALITPEKMQKLANRYLDTENYFFLYLIPEKQ